MVFFAIAEIGLLQKVCCCIFAEMKRKTSTSKQVQAAYKLNRVSLAHSFEGVLMNYSLTDTGAKMVNIAVVGDIGGWYGYNKETLQQALSENVNATEINLYISSGGGDLEDALVMYDMLKGHNAFITVYLVGVVASAATVIACAGDRIVISQQCLYMIHNASMGAYGNYRDLLKSVEVLQKYEKRALNIYQRQTELDAGAIQSMLDAETWLEPETAVQLGFANEVVDYIPFLFDPPQDYARSHDHWEDDYYYMQQDNTGAVMYLNQAEKLLQKGIEPYQIKGPKPNKKQSIQNKTANMANSIYAQLARLLGKSGVINESQIEETTAKLEKTEGLAEMLTDEAISNAVENGMKDKLASIEQSIATMKASVNQKAEPVQAPKMETSDLLELLTNASEEDKQAFKDALGISEGVEETQETLEALEESLAEIEQRHNEEKEVLNQKISALGGATMKQKKGTRKFTKSDANMGLQDEEDDSPKANSAQMDLINTLRERAKRVSQNTSNKALKEKMAAMRSRANKK